MKTNKTSFKKIFSGLKGSGTVHKRGLYSPHRDWMLIIITFFVFLVLSIGVHYFIYVMAKGGTLFNESAEEEIFNVAIRRNVIDEVVSEYGNKRLNIETPNESEAFLNDPSSFD